jgi:hypothetical protein
MAFIKYMSCLYEIRDTPLLGMNIKDSSNVVQQEIQPVQEDAKKETKLPIVTNKFREKQQITQKEPYIYEKKFEVGLIKEWDGMPADLNGSRVLKPINALGVKYGLNMNASKEDCPCLDFVKSP